MIRFAWVTTIAAELVAVANLFTFNFPEEYLQNVGYPEKATIFGHGECSYIDDSRS
jgi:hypothetical protein